jgi:hypothetical protein
MQTEKTKTGGTALLLSSRLNFHNEVDGFDDKSITKTTTHGDLHRFGCRAAVWANNKKITELSAVSRKGSTNCGNPRQTLR